MAAMLKDAITAARDGDYEQAQLLVADVIQSDPDNPQAWYLLSRLVDSDARRAAYLNKVLTLDPTHERARAEFAALPPEIITELAATGTPLAMEIPQPTPEPPEWLRPLGAEPVPVTAVPEESRPADLPPAAEPPVQPRQPAAKPPQPAGRSSGNGWLIGLWIVLAFITVLVLGLLAYLLLS